MSYGTLQIEKMTTESGYSLGAGNASSFKNRIINGGMAIFQRGTAATTDGAYSVDRWRFVKSNDATESTSQNTDAPTGFSYSLRNTVATGDATIGATQYSGFEQAIEGYNIADLGWGTANAKSVTLSFWVRSSVTGTYTGSVRNYNDTRINPFNFTINVANTWEQKTVTITGDTGGTWQTTTSSGIIFAVYAALGSSYSSGTAGTWGTSPAFGCGSPVNGIASNGNIFAISGVQLEAGTVATSFDQRPYGTEFDLCRRYCEVYSNTNCDNLPSTIGQTDVSNRPEINLNYYVKRAAPTITASTNNMQFNTLANTNIPITSFAGALVGSTVNGTNLFFGTASGVTSGTLSGAGCIQFTGACVMTISAEL